MEISKVDSHLSNSAEFTELVSVWRRTKVATNPTHTHTNSSNYSAAAACLKIKHKHRLAGGKLGECVVLLSVPHHVTKRHTLVGRKTLEPTHQHQEIFGENVILQAL